MINLGSIKRNYDFLEKRMGDGGFEPEDVEQICRAYFADIPALIGGVERLRSFEQIAFGIINLVNGEDFGGLSAEALGAILDCWAMEAEKANQDALEDTD